VREFVTKVHVKSNQIVSKGEPLFEISKQRFKNAVDQATATLDAAGSTISQLEAMVTAAEATIKKSVADIGIAKAVLDTAKRLQRSSPAAVAKLTIAEAEASYDTAQAAGEVAIAALKQDQASLAGAKDSADVARAALKQAQFNLSQTTYRSSVDGLIMNFQVREQTPVARWQLTSVGTIMDLSATRIVVIYPQNLLKYVKSGDKAEIAFMRKPGSIATGTVDAVVQYTGEGQFVASGTLPVAATVGSKGLLAVRIRLDDKDLAKTLPLGAAGTTAIYTDFGKPFQIISKIALRIKGWLYYLPI
jgi:membrane fusion protein (multidrug efflux system)